MDLPEPGSSLDLPQATSVNYRIDIETCPECGVKLRVIACIEDPPQIAKIPGLVRKDVVVGK